MAIRIKSNFVPKNAKEGAIEGFKTGAFLGGTVGLVKSVLPVHSAENVAIGTIGTGLLGGAIGAGYAALVGHRNQKRNSTILKKYS